MGEVLSIPTEGDAEMIRGIVTNYLSNRPNCVLHIGVFQKGKKRVYRVTPNEIAVNPEQKTFYEIGSITKTITATTLARVIQSKKIQSLNQPVYQILNEPPLTNLKTGTTPTTLLHLATHSSGLPRLPTGHSFGGVDPYKNYTPSKLHSFLSTYQPTNPNPSYAYSNFGFGLLGYCLTKATNQSYQDLVQSLIFQPANMTHTFTNMDGTVDSSLIQGYQDNGTTPTSPWHWDVMVGCGGIVSCAEDMLNYIDFNLNPPEEVQEAINACHNTWLKSGSTTVGLGWHKLQMDGEEVIWHNGGTYSGTIFLGINRLNGVGVIVLSNIGFSDKMPLDAVALDVLRVVMNGKIKLKDYVAYF